MNKLLGLLTLVCSLSAASAFADTTDVVMTIATDAFPGTTSILVTRDDQGNAKSLTYRTPTGKGKQFTLAQLKTPQPLLNTSGYDVIFLSVESDFTAEKGGHADVKFLHNALSSDYRVFRISMDMDTLTLRSDPDPDQVNSDNNEYTGVFKHLFCPKNTVLFGTTVGIDRIVPSP